MRGQGQSQAGGDGMSGRALESLLAFWAEAGVDTLYEDGPVNRLAERVRQIRPAPQGQPVGQSQGLPRGDERSLPPPTRVGGHGAAPAGPDISAAIAQARELAAGCETLEALAAAIAGFDGCGLKFEGAKQAVFERGEPNADVMIIGEGPGGEEDVQGLPFVGRAGKLLDKMIGAAGLTGRVFITNTVYWRPPGNRTPTPQEQLVCQPFLERAIVLVSPKLLLLAGGASAKSVLQRSEGILSLRGRWFDWTSSDGSQSLPVMPTLHPAFLLRQPGAKKRAWADMLTLMERLDRPERPG
jgi:uracil-DNA glycosylase family 4